MADEIINEIKVEEQKAVVAIDTEESIIRAKLLKIVKVIVKPFVIAYKAIKSVIITIIDFFITMHSEATGVSWKRFACTGIIVWCAWMTKIGVERLLITGDMLTKIICTAIGAIAVVYGAGIIAANLPGGVEKSAYDFIAKLKSFFK